MRTPRPLLLGMLLLAMLGFDLGLVLNFRKDSTAASSLFLGNAFAQLGLLGLWLTLGARWLLLRMFASLAGILLAAAAFIAAWVREDDPLFADMYVDWLNEFFIPLATMFALFLAIVAFASLGLRFLGMRWQASDAFLTSPERQHQFTLWQMLSLMTGLAPPAFLLKYVEMPPLGEDVSTFAAYASIAFLGGISIAAAWFGRAGGKWLLRFASFAITATVLGGFSMAILKNVNEGWVMGIYALFTFAFCKLSDLAGYPIARQLASQSNAEVIDTAQIDAVETP